MADSNKKKKVSGPFSADFVYTDALLKDFEKFYQEKQKTRPAVRIVLGIFGAMGALYFGYGLYTEGFGITRVGWLIACSLMLLVAFSSGHGNGADNTVDQYRKYYLNVGVHFDINEDGVQMQLATQKKGASSKFTKIYGLYETEHSFYFVIKGKAYYIISKKAIEGGTPEDLHDYMESHCQKTFLSYSV